MTLNEKSYKTLEFDKILELLAQNAVSDGAKDLCRNLAPLFSLEEVENNLNLTSDAVFLLGKKGAPAFGSIHDVTASLLRAEKGASLSLQELLHIAHVLKITKKLIEYMDESMAGLSIKTLFSRLEEDRYTCEKIDRCIISAEEVADIASGELADIRRKINRAILKAKDILSGMVRSTTYQKFLQEPIVTMRGDRYVVPVKAEFRGEIKGLVHDTSGSGSTLFIEPMGVVEANNELRVLKIKEEEEIARIIAELSADVAAISDKIKWDYKCIVLLDFVFAKAKFAYKLKANRPTMNNEGKINIIGGRHPLINKDMVVPISVSLGIDFDLLIITGPNTGGKTVSLKTIGLFTLMAQAGLFVPFDEGSTLSLFDNVLCDIGDEQSIEQSLSTFSSHMTNIVKIMDIVDENSLVLFDELGAGTDPIEGAALAIAILEQAKAFKAKIVATTHYAELKNYALNTKRVENASCEFDVNTLRPTYKLLVGIPGKSNAFAISSKLGLSDNIINNAKKYVTAEDASFEKILSDLEAKRQEMERKKKAAMELELQMKTAKAQIDAEKEKFDTSKDKEVMKARQEAKRVLSSAKRMYEDLMSELEELKKQKDKEDFSARVSQAKASLKSTLSRLDDTVDPVVESNDSYELPREIRLGDTVFVTDINKNATVMSIPDNKGEVTVQAGNLKMKVKLNSIRLIEKPQPPKKKNVNITRPLKNATAQIEMELDLRGQMVDEAILNIDKFLDNAAMQGLTTVRLIHGKGTGALRAGVTNYLKHHPHVKSHRLGVFGEGESGVTIVEVK